MILAIDVGSSSVKGALFSESGACLGKAAVPVATRSSGDGVQSEVEAEDWLAALRDIAGELLSGSRPGRRDGARGGSRGLEAVAISGNGPTFLPVDTRGRPLHLALTWADRRAVAEADAAGAAAGIRLDPSFTLPKALWFMRRAPEIYEATASFLSCPEYLCRVLSGQAVTVVPEGYERHYGDARTFSALGLEGSKFPPAARPGLVLGETTAEGEARTGVPRGAQVVAVGPDYLASLVGSATTRPGRACDRSGSSDGINLCALEGTDDPRLVSVPHIVPPYANISGMISSTGAAADWFRRAAHIEGESYEDFFREVRGAAAGALGLVFLPYLSGERSPIWDASARGAFVGLTLAHGRPEMARAVVESSAYAMRDVIEVMEGCGAEVRELRVTGRPGRSDDWNQIKADVTGRPLERLAFEDAELLGDLCFALAALGRAEDPASAAEGLVGFDRIFEPDASMKPTYDELFAAYREAYAALKPIFPKLGSGGR